MNKRLAQAATFVVEERQKPFKRHTILCLVLPAFVHDVIDVRRTAVWPRQSSALLQVGDHLRTCHVLVRLVAKRKHFPQRDAETPHVAGVRKRAVIDCFRCVPVERQLIRLCSNRI